MRFERQGGPPDLQAAFKTLILQHLAGRALDDNQDKEAAEGKFPDFACFRDLLLIEMKHLETDQNDRINEIFETKIAPDEMPYFFGTREVNLNIEKISNGAEISTAITIKLGRTIENILRQANAQFTDYRTRHPRKNSVNICVILNSSLGEYTPKILMSAVHGKMKVDQLKPRFSNIDAVIYISEKHFQILPDGRAGLALVIYEGSGAANNPWKMQFVDRVTSKWALMRTGDALVEDGDPQAFEPIHDVPRSMKRYEFWILEYARNPYLKSLTLESLRVLFHRTVAFKALTFFKGNWSKPSREHVTAASRQFQHINEEINRRKIDVRSLDQGFLTPDEKAQVYVGFPIELVELLADFPNQNEG